jgi:hypothetical protein
MSRSFAGLIVFASVALVSAQPGLAADLGIYPRQQRVAADVLDIDRGPNPYCGPRCGCPETIRVRHRSLVQYYPSGFDPRTRNEPLYAYGAKRTYVRYVDPRYPDLVYQY